MNLLNKHFEDADITKQLTRELLNIVDNNTVIVCIGTDKCIGDSMGPLIGTILKENHFKLPVYGTIDDPIHALNIDRRLREIKTIHPHANIIGIDACLGEIDSIGFISLRDTPIHPGKGVNKTLPKVGDYSVIGIIESSDNGLFNKNLIRLDFIMKISKIIAKSLLRATNTLISENEEAAVCNL